MVSVRKRKMAKSLVKKNTVRAKDTHKRIVIKNNPVIAKHWDPKLTLSQNYKRIGLATSLNAPSGGVEKKIVTNEDHRKERERKERVRELVENSLNETDPSKIPVGQARLIRDPETNAVVEIIHGTMKIEDVHDAEDSEPGIIEELAKYHAENAKETIEIGPDEIGSLVYEQLYNKYGDDYEKMKWDQKLNTSFLSEGQLKRKIVRWKKYNNIE